MVESRAKVNLNLRFVRGQKLICRARVPAKIRGKVTTKFGKNRLYYRATLATAEGAYEICLAWN